MWDYEGSFDSVGQREANKWGKGRAGTEYSAALVLGVQTRAGGFAHWGSCRGFDGLATRGPE